MAATIQEMMTTTIASCPPSTTLTEAAQVMRDRNIGDLLITDGNGDLAGIVTDRDLVVRCLADGASGDSAIGDAFTTELTYLAPNSSVDEAIQMMRDHSLRRIPVVEQGHAVGIVSLGDLAMERDPGSALGDISAAAPNN